MRAAGEFRSSGAPQPKLFCTEARYKILMFLKNIFAQPNSNINCPALLAKARLCAMWRVLSNRSSARQLWSRLSPGETPAAARRELSSNMQ